MFIKYNPNPNNNRVGDCVIRAISKFLNQDWNTTYIDLCVEGYTMKDMPSSNSVWSSYLLNNNCSRHIIPNSCPDCYSVRQFCYDNPYGEYLLATGTHIVTVVDGNYYDTWDSGDEIPIYLFRKEN